MSAESSSEQYACEESTPDVPRRPGLIGWADVSGVGRGALRSGRSVGERRGLL